jgi:hypothetical protein
MLHCRLAETLASDQKYFVGIEVTPHCLLYIDHSASGFSVAFQNIRVQRPLEGARSVVRTRRNRSSAAYRFPHPRHRFRVVFNSIPSVRVNENSTRYQ